MNDVLADFESHRARLFGLAYRMLGSASEAEEVVQQAWLRAREHGAADVASPRAWLGAVVTRLCLDHLRSARVRRERYVGPWLPEPLHAAEAPLGEARLLRDESLSYAFLVMLQSLSPAERAVFLLREVFEESYAEIAEAIEKSEATCRQIFRRALAQLEARRPRHVPSAEERDRLHDAFVDAVHRGDLAKLRDVLHEDVHYESDGGGRVYAALRAIDGADPVARLFVGIAKSAPARVRITRELVNGEPGIALWNGEGLFCVGVAEIEDGRLRRIWQVLNPDKLAAYAAGLGVPVTPLYPRGSS